MRQEADIHAGQTSEFDAARLLDRLPGMVYRCSWDGDWTMNFVSQGAMELTGYGAQEFAPGGTVRWSEIIDDEDLLAVVKRFRQAASDRRAFRIRYRIRKAGNHVRWIHEHAWPVTSEPASPVHFEGYVVADDDSSREARSPEAAHDRNRLVDQALDIFVAVDANGHVITWNRQAERKSGWARTEAVGQDIVDLVVEAEYRDQVREKIRELAQSHVAEAFSSSARLRAIGRNGEPFPVEARVWSTWEDGRLQLNAFVRDRTSVDALERRVAELEDRLSRLSRVDELTGLASRSVLDTELARSVAFAHRWCQPLSVVVLSPRPRETHGNEVAHDVSQALVEISDVIRTSCRVEDVAARFDDAAVLLLRQTTIAEARIVADRLCRKLGTSDFTNRIDLRVGIASLDRQDDASTLVKRALQNSSAETTGTDPVRASAGPEESGPILNRV